MKKTGAYCRLFIHIGLHPYVDTAQCVVINALFYKFPKNRAPALSWWRMMLRNSWLS